MGQSSANGFYDSSVNFEFPTPLEKAQVVASSSAPLANIQDIQTYKLSNYFFGQNTKYNHLTTLTCVICRHPMT